MKNLLKLISNHFGIKASCFFLAIFLWLYVTSETIMRKNFHIPVKIEIPSAMSVASVNTGIVLIGVEGERKAILKATSKDFSLIISMKGKNLPGIYTETILPDDIKPPSGITVTNVSPTNIVTTLKKG
jgi:YbbR domain-containing protein